MLHRTHGGRCARFAAFTLLALVAWACDDEGGNVQDPDVGITVDMAVDPPDPDMDMAPPMPDMQRPDLSVPGADMRVEITPCEDDTDCPEAERCNGEGACVAGCRPGNCPAGLECADGVCVLPPCLADGDCPDATYCSAGECLVGCRRDPDNCPAGQQCDARNLCVPNCDGPEVCGNAEDEDCDGEIDDVDVCGEPPPDTCVADGACDTGAPGDCQAGRVVCPDGPMGEPQCVPVAEPGQERCDGARDEDCDGQVDEGYLINQACRFGQGACEAEGVTACRADGLATECVADGDDPFAEVCDGTDNDCDGRVDEAFLGLGDGCAVGVGACQAPGVLRCADDGQGTVCDAVARPAGEETCNGRDDDCDGLTDEAFEGVGEACEVGVGGCRVQAVQVCTADGQGLRCGAVPTAPIAEQCDGVDNDCDGQIDEGPGGADLVRACYTGPDGTAGQGQCRGGTQLCARGAWGRCEGQVIPFPEVCDGADRDCDGRTDEGADGGPLTEPCYEGPLGTAGVGACAAGVRACLNGVLTECRGEVLPQREICDGADNDCNGAADDVGEAGCGCEAGAEQGCYSGPAGTQDVGRCRAGTQTCTEQGAFGGCAEEVLPRPELCNGEDDDCDGQIDENIAAVGRDCTLGQGGCGRLGAIVCDPQAGLRCDAEIVEPVAETCNAEDDDCDGRVDEDFGRGGACTVGLGACAREGFVVCAEDETGGCSEQPGEPGEEICNGVDDDCDGQTDEGLGLGQRCASGVDACRVEGVNECAPDGTVVCSAQAPPAGPEQCDGADNDCDGQVDEGLGLGEACNVGDGACLRQGVRRCDGEGGVECFGGAADGVEVCNGLDDDCDGRADEGNPGAGEACDTGTPGLCAVGEGSCFRGELRCFVVTQPAAEVCDGQDNDCDGTVDEDFGGGQPCTVGEGACATEGVAVCNAAGDLVCPVEAGAPGDEVCDGADNDCDGQVDEAAPRAGGFCTRGQGACRADGEIVCRDGALTCGAEIIEPSAELCNATDDDCDGLIDEGFPVGQVCARGQGVCAAEGRFRCTEAGEAACDAEVIEPGVEACNDLDDDCDGVVDNGGVCPDLEPPEVTVEWIPPQADPEVEVTLRVTAEDRLGEVAELTVTVNDAPLELDENGEATFVPPAPGRYLAAAVAVDDSDNRAEAQASLPVRDPNDVTNPDVLILSPEDTTELTQEAVEIRARLLDDNFERYEVRLSSDGVSWETVATGFEGGEDVPVYTLDPTLQAPGLLMVRVQGYDLSGNNLFHQISLVVPNGISVGDSRLTVRDFRMSVLGLPIIIDRDYDSRRRTRVGDFGYGWQLGQKSVELVEDTQGNVGVQLPDGRREVFGITFDIPPILPIGFVEFVPPAGVTSTLEPVGGCAAVNNPDLGLVCLFTGRPPAQTFSDYILTTPDGRRWEINDQTGLTRLTDPEGRTLTFTDDGIESSAGLGVAFERDEAGRIVAVTDPEGQTTRYGYDEAGDLVSVIDPTGGEQRYEYAEGHRLTAAIAADGNPVMRTEYDDEGRKAAVVDALGNATRYAYDLGGRRTTVTDRRGNTIVYDYDEGGRVVRRTDELGNAVESTYDDAGRLVAEDDANGGRWQYTLDAAGNRTQVVNPAGEIYEYEYSPLGKPTLYRTPLGAEIEQTYDAEGRLVSVRNAEGGMVSVEYDAAGNRSAMVGPDGARTEFAYDAAGNITRVDGPDGLVREYAYNAIGKITAYTDERGGRSEIEYDGVGRITGFVDAEGNRHAFERDGLGRMTQHTDPEGRVRAWRFEARGLLAEAIDGLGNRTRYSYDPEGDLVGVTDALGHERAFERDAGGRITRTIDPLGHETAQAYDRAGRLTQRVDADGLETTFEYDAGDRLLAQRTVGGPQRTFTFDEAGRMREAAVDGVVRAFTYDGDDRLLQTVSPEGQAMDAEYDAQGRLVGLAGPGGETRYEYTGIGRVARIVDPAGRAMDFERDGDGRLLRQTLPGGVEVSYAYDRSGKPTTWQVTRLGVVLDGGERTYDASGRMIREVRHAGPIRTLGYDAAGQLVSEALSDDDGRVLWSADYGYDAVGNRITTTTRQGVGRSAYDAADRLTDDGAFGYTWTDSGRVRTRTNLQTGVVEGFDYDSEGRLVGWSAPDGDAPALAIERDALGIPHAWSVGEATTQLLTFLGDPVAGLRGGQVAWRHVYGDQVDQVLATLSDAGDQYYVLDPRGDVVAVFDAAGEPVRRHLFSGFGQALTEGGLGDFDAVPDGGLGFGGRPWLAGPGLVDLRDRHYDPRSGRFIQPDPLAGDPNHPKTQHRYIYGLNDPFRYRDPTGRVAAISYAFRAAQFVLGSGTSAPNGYEMIGSLIGFFHGFAQSGLVFMANVLEISSQRGGFPQDAWGEAISRTAAQMAEITETIGRFAGLDNTGFAGAFVGGAGFQVGISFEVKLIPGTGGAVVEALGGPNPGCKVELVIKKTVGGFKSGVSQFLNYVGQLAPQSGWETNAEAGCQ